MLFSTDLTDLTVFWLDLVGESMTISTGTALGIDGGRPRRLGWSGVGDGMGIVLGLRVNTLFLMDFLSNLNAFWRGVAASGSEMEGFLSQLREVSADLRKESWERRDNRSLSFSRRMICEEIRRSFSMFVRRDLIRMNSLNLRL